MSEVRPSLIGEGAMTAIEISGYIQIVIGAIGIVVTMLTAPSLLDASRRIRAGDELPTEFSGVAAVVRIFSITFVFIVFVFLIALGLSITLSVIAKSTGASHPMLFASLLVAALLSATLTATFTTYRSRLGVPAFIGAAVLATLSGVAALVSDISGFWGPLTAGVAVFLATGLGTIMSYADGSGPG